MTKLRTRTALLLAVVPTVVAVAQPLEAHATTQLFDWVATDGSCTMEVDYNIGDPKGTATSTLTSYGMHCPTAWQGLSYQIYDFLGVAGAAGQELPAGYSVVCGAGRVSNPNSVSVTSVPGSSCSAPEAPGLHTIMVIMSIETSTDVYQNTTTFEYAVVP